ncbi:UDP-N-acetylglucosamine UDP-glucose GDP-mannose transporter isoform X1 [Pelobates cultripes]|uniref:UDP-N-acetylglucosamine UDP-glucose GDP-mannose transporter isoform X1 n=1 Tax=Pelobates cultripes TaxID=61616 RepID=A0AAD1W9A4_PELCU|nr:UDP-N-acetylglucosamine UDP-glucose GDP-mannose transporter isoform X1 [Pelobates cultripes]
MSLPSSQTANLRLARILSALFYGLSSFLIVLVNKTVLTTYRFPSSTCLGIGQMGITILVLYIGKLYSIITFPDFDRQIPKKLFPLPLIYIGNHLTGLSSTQKLSLPMFTVLRKFSIPLTLILEIIILRKRYTFSVVLSVVLMVLGAFIAASFDLSFNLEGYIIVLLNDLFTALYGVYTKEKIDPKELGKYGVLFYNASFMILPTLLFTLWTGEFWQAVSFSEWTNIYFTAQFVLSCLMGFILLYSIVLCSYYNSALTTTVIGALKNVSVAYIGIIIGGDYTFSWLNFIGLNICMSGGISYSFFTLWSNTQPKDNKNEVMDAISTHHREDEKNATCDLEQQLPIRHNDK